MVYKSQRMLLEVSDKTSLTHMNKGNCFTIPWELSKSFLLFHDFIYSLFSETKGRRANGAGGLHGWARSSWQNSHITWKGSRGGSRDRWLGRNTEPLSVRNSGILSPWDQRESLELGVLHCGEGRWQVSLWDHPGLYLKGHDDWERFLRTGGEQMSHLHSRSAVSWFPRKVMEKIILEMFPSILKTERE